MKFIYFLSIFQIFVIQISSSYKITKLKCEEYKKQYSNPCQKKGIPLIVGGTKAEEAEFPHMVLIGYGTNQIRWDCGGALISDMFVLTAAHCVKSRENGEATKVMLGTISRDESSPHEIRNVSKLIVHTKYKQPLKYNDIALLKLDAPVKFNDYIKPICLNYKTADYSQNKTEATSIGFGKTKFTNSEGSKDLLQVDLPILKNSICDPYFKTSKRVMPMGVIETMICAGVLKGGKDTCQGDSGGPMQIYDDKICSDMLIGVISFGKFCGYAKSPSIYTNVYYYVPWIEQHVWNSST